MKKSIVLIQFLLYSTSFCLLSWKPAPSNNFMILRLWGPSDMISETENKNFRLFKDAWEKENIPVKEHQWKNSSELTNYLQSLNLNLMAVSGWNGLKIKGNSYDYNFISTETKVIFIIDNREPVGYFIGDSGFEKVQMMLEKAKQ